MINLLNHIKEYVLKPFCKHPRLLHLFHGRCCYQKGRQLKKDFYYGDIFFCPDCHEEIFRWNLSEKKLTAH